MRRYHHADFDLATLLDAKAGRTVSVCIPARNEAPTIAHVVEQVLAAGTGHRHLADEIVVIDDRSEDDTAALALAAGAKVVPNEAGPGKGSAMRRGMSVTGGEIVLFLDGDVENTAAHFITGMLGPLLTDPSLRLVKATYRRSLGGRADEGGRVTELVAKPLLALLFPELAALGQPLSGECAGWRESFAVVDFPDGYGVELATVVDVYRAYGAASLAEVDLGSRVHRNRPLSELAPMAAEIIETALARAAIAPL